MTPRAITLGLIGALAIAGLGYINNFVIELNPIELGWLLPVSVVGTVVLYMILVNPLLHRIRKGLALQSGEVAVIILMMTAAIGIPTRGLMEQFTSVVAMPAHWNRLTPGWQEYHLLDYVPTGLLVKAAPDNMVAVDDFITGKASPGDPIGLTDIPWDAWKAPLACWLPLILLTAAAAICLSLIVHSQWSARERLRYPIADFISTLTSRKPGEATGAIYRNRSFWIGLSVVLGIHLVNGSHVWLGGDGNLIPLMFDFGAVGQAWPRFFSYPQAGYLLHPRLYPIVIAFAFFLATDVSLTLGVSQYLLAIAWLPLIAFGVPMYTHYMAGGPMGWHRAGAYVALSLMLIYTGRRYYWGVIKSAVSFRPQEKVEPYAAWACRIFLASGTAFVIIVSALGLDWTLSLLTFGLMMVQFLGVSRIAAETGLFFIHARWTPLGLILGLIGGFAFGPVGMVFVGLICAILCLDTSVALMPYFTNALRITDDGGVKPGRSGWLAFGTFLPALLLAVVIVLWANYNYGVPRSFGWNFQRIPVMPFETVEKELLPLKLSNTIHESINLGPVERLLRMKPDRVFLWSAGSGFVLVLVVSALRLRFNGWPLHPVLFLVIATHPMARFNHSFLIGCLLKAAVVRFGGQKAYHGCKPLMIGIIAGDLLGAVVFMVAGALYYFFTGSTPPSYRAFAG